VGLYELHVQLKYGLWHFAQSRERNSKNIHKGRKEDMYNPPKIKGDAEEKYLSL
jgi:hypothetical protein